MLVLTRREGEAVIIDTPAGEMTVSVELLDGGQVKLGFEAPQAFKIAREELLWRES